MVPCYTAQAPDSCCLISGLGVDQLVQQLQQQLAEQERANLEKDNELQKTEEAAFSNASFAYMWELAYTDASQQQVIYMNKYEVAKAELETVSEALQVARIGNGALSPSLFATLTALLPLHHPSCLSCQPILVSEEVSVSAPHSPMYRRLTPCLGCLSTHAGFAHTALSMSLAC